MSIFLGNSIDLNLVKEYFRLQNNNDSCFETNEKEEKKKQNNVNDIERMKVVENPWYPDSKIERRIATIPFGMIIIDERQVDIELIDHNNPKKFSGAILIKDETFSKTMKNFYQKMWNRASETFSSDEQKKISSV